MDAIFSSSALSALLTVLVADLVLAGDNAIVVGIAAAGLPAQQRRQAIFFGIVVATVLRILFAAIAVQLLAVIGLTLAGGILLLWVAWKLWREIQHMPAAVNPDETVSADRQAQNFRSALTKIVVADVSMSLDNVLAVAGAARDHMWVLVTGLVISVALTGLASSFIARMLGRFRWLSYLGLLMIAYVAVRMIWDGAQEVLAHIG
jgi:YjbE family integral membrane protein